MSDDNTVMTTSQVCERLGISRATFFREANRGNPNFPLKVQMSAGRVAYLKSDVERYIAAQQNPNAWRHPRNVKAA